MTGTLYVVATPIGNLDDWSARAVQVLNQVDVVAAEDTRHSRRLLQHYGIATSMVALHEHNEAASSQALIKRLAGGESVAVITDAGMPGISDPGFIIVRMAQDEEIRVSVIPGACAPIVALVGSGLPTDRFCFEGFLPRKSAARDKALRLLANETRTLIFFESPHRAEKSLADMRRVFGEAREAAIARELTKRFESIHRGTLAELCGWVSADPIRCKGEIVLVVAGCPDSKVSGQLMETALVLLAELPPSQAARLASALTGESRRVCYDLIQSIANSRNKSDT